VSVTGHLASDGWEHASAYHGLVNHAAEGTHAMLMPDVVMPSGQSAVLLMPHEEHMRRLLDENPVVRAVALIGFARYARRLAYAQQGVSRRGDG
jgi:hypothetical protein